MPCRGGGRSIPALRCAPAGMTSSALARGFEPACPPPSPRRPPRSLRPADAILVVNNIEVIYDHVILVLKGVSLSVPRGGIVAILGANGAGKTTTLKAISNLLRAERGEVTKGSIEFEGERVDRLTPNDLVRRGCIQVLEGRHCFGHLTDRGEPPHRRLHAPRRQRRDPPRPRDDLRLLPAPEAAPRRHGRLHLGRRAADVRHRPRHDVAARR